MPLVWNPIAEKNVREGSAPFQKMLRQIMNERIPQRVLDNWDEEQDVWTEVIKQRYGPQFREEQEERKKRVNERRRQQRERKCAERGTRNNRRKRRARTPFDLNNLDGLEEDSPEERVAEFLGEYFEKDEPTEVDLAKSVLEDSRWDIVRDEVKKLKLRQNVRYDILIKCTVQEGVETKDGGVHKITGFANRRIEDTDFARNVLGKDVVGKVIDFFLHFEGGYDVYEIESLEIEASRSTDRPSGRDLQKQILQSVGKGAKAVKVDLPYVDQNFTDDGTCGFQMIEKRFKIPRKTVQRILEIEDVIGGTTIDNIGAVCSDKNTGHIVIGLDGEVRYKKSSKESCGPYTE
ncbi:hypothetical protein HDV00_012616 [Rhizophlyctis rosea]|nr:hypothetical protein HDV00_012616 [Rhizophlyctis rosea]